MRLNAIDRAMYLKDINEPFFSVCTSESDNIEVFLIRLIKAYYGN